MLPSLGFSCEDLALAFPALSVGISSNPNAVPVVPAPFPAFSWANMAAAAASKPVPRKPDAPRLLPPAPNPNPASAQDLANTKSDKRSPLVDSTSFQSSSSSSVPTSNSLSSTSQPSRILMGGGGGGSQASHRAALEDDGLGWINQSNLRSRLASGEGMLGSNTIVATKTLAVAPSSSSSVLSTGKNEGEVARKLAAAAEASSQGCSVACVTTDFSMQNVMMQMGLCVASVDGLRIQKVKQWVLRCMACYRVHYELERLFCGKCGANHLSRVAASIDARTGLLHLHLKKNYHVNTRGKLYSLPKPGQQGRFHGELLLREDQLISGIWRQKCVKIKKEVTSAFGERVASDVGLHVNKSQSIKVGLGSRNPNADKGRERRGKSNKKKQK